MAFSIHKEVDITKRVPFSVSQNDSRTLVSQVVDGIRQGIVGGFYRPGDVVPSYRDLSSIFGVSQIVTKAALRQLAEEGFIVSRPRIGSVVRDRMEKQWRGHVLFVSPEGDENYIETVLGTTLCNRLSEAGYLFTQVFIPYTLPEERFDFSRLDVALAQSVDLIVAVFPRPQMLTRLARQKVPYAVFSECRKFPPSAVGGTWLNLNLAMSDFAVACKAEGVKEVLQFYFWPSMGDATEALRKVGVRVRKVLVKVDESKGAMIGARRAAMEMFSRLIAKGRLPRGTICFINDDYLASGALMAIACAGLKVPEDIRLVTLANKRLGPVYIRELTRMEFDARHAGEVLSDAVLEYLKTGVYPSNSVVGPVWVEGETMKTT